MPYQINAKALVREGHIEEAVKLYLNRSNDPEELFYATRLSFIIEGNFRLRGELITKTRKIMHDKRDSVPLKRAL